MDAERFKKNIKKARFDLKMTQQEAADRIGISRTAYRNFENGSTKIFSDHVSRLASLAGKTEEEIVLGYNPMLESPDPEGFEERMSQMREVIRLQRIIIEKQEQEINVLKGKSR